jgi:hypothetical protein
MSPPTLPVADGRRLLIGTVESGRKEIDDRGTGAHDKFEIAVPRGGLPELLAEAKRKDRRFDAAIC